MSMNETHAVPTPFGGIKAGKHIVGICKSTRPKNCKATRKMIIKTLSTYHISTIIR